MPEEKQKEMNFRYREVRDEISEIMCRWYMPTRQAAINEIMALIQREIKLSQELPEGTNDA
jgi:hypothetical protein